MTMIVPVLGDRLGFVLQDFTRSTWVSDLARRVWEPRMRRIAAAWLDIELRAVEAGVRACSVAIVTPDELLAKAPTWAEHGLSALPLEKVGITGLAYSATLNPAAPGEPFTFRIVLGTPTAVARFKRAWDAADQHAIGELLGYPSCCRTFFERVWVDQQMVDTTWPMGALTAPPSPGETTVEVAGSAQANILWRWMGLRAVSHLPCRFDCSATVEVADGLIRVGRDAGYRAQMDWLLEILSWPVEWSALHGIAEIKTPVVKISTRTDATARKYTVRWVGTAYPAEGGQGLGFPYRQFAGTPLTESRAYKRGLGQPLPMVSAPPAWYALDNEWRTVWEMEQAHAPIVSLATEVLAGRPASVLDLGCGNGALLEAIAAANPGTALFGIEFDPDRAAHAGQILEGMDARVFVGDLRVVDEPWADGRRYALALIMPGRLLEATPAQAERLRARLRDQCDAILVYAYDGWMTRYDGLAAAAGLAGLAAAAGLTLSSPPTESTARAGLCVAAFARVPAASVGILPNGRAHGGNGLAEYQNHTRGIPSAVGST